MIKNTNLYLLINDLIIWNEEKYIPDIEEGKRRSEIVSELRADTEKAIVLMKGEGVDYLMCRVLAEKQEYGELTDSLTEVFRNSHYIIYEL